MSLPDKVRETLKYVGQVAAEVSCRIEGYREFVSVYAGPRACFINATGRYPYLDDAKTIYRCIRFRIASDLIERDVDVGPDDLIDLQEMRLPSEEGVEFVLGVWRVSPDDLLSPKDVAIPV